MGTNRTLKYDPENYWWKRHQDALKTAREPIQ